MVDLLLNCTLHPLDYAFPTAWQPRLHILIKVGKQGSKFVAFDEV